MQGSLSRFFPFSTPPEDHEVVRIRNTKGMVTWYGEVVSQSDRKRQGTKFGEIIPGQGANGQREGQTEKLRFLTRIRGKWAKGGANRQPRFSYEDEGQMGKRRGKQKK